MVPPLYQAKEQKNKPVKMRNGNGKVRFEVPTIPPRKKSIAILNKCNRKFANCKLRREKQAIERMLIHHLRQKATIIQTKQNDTNSTDK